MNKYMLTFCMSLLSYSLFTMSFMSGEDKELILELFDLGVVQFNTEAMLICPTATTEMQSPYYINLRHLISHPEVHQKVIAKIVQKASELEFDLICGVPYAALALASCTAYELNIPLIMRRTQAKTHGINKKLEGTFSSGMCCLVIEDVICVGTSILQTIADLEQAGLVVHDCIVLFDRQHWHMTPYKNGGYKVHALFSINDFLQVLYEAERIDTMTVEKITEWTKKQQTDWSNEASTELSIPQVGKTYRHYKGKCYKVIAIGNHSETLEPHVVYQALYDCLQFGDQAIWVRPLSLFVGIVSIDGKTIKRFVEIE